MTATNNEAPNEEKPKLEVPTKLEVICNMIALIKKLKSPKVKTVKGNDNSIKIGFITMFKMDKTKLAIRAVRKLST